MALTFSVTDNEKEYRDFEENAQYANLLQSWDWAKIKDNWEHVYYIGKDENGKTAASALALIRRLPMGFGLMYIPRGPVMEDYSAENMKAFTKFLQKDAKKRRVLFAKVDTPIQDREFVRTFEEAGARHVGYTMEMQETIQPRLVSIVYNRPEWKENLPKHTKRLVKDADKRHVEVEFGGIELAGELARLTGLTEDRKGVHLRDRDYFEKLARTYGDDCVISLAYVDIDKLYQETLDKKQQLEAKLAAMNPNAKKQRTAAEEQLASVSKFLTRYENLIKSGVKGRTAIAGILSISHGGCYEMLYAGMDEKFKEFMPQYRQYIDNFEYAFDKLGDHCANMGGIEFSDDDGLKKFKRNFNPDEEEYVGEFDIPVMSLLYPMASKAYKKMKVSM